MIAETILLLRYSRKNVREKNVGKFRMATGLGTTFSPLLISLTSLFLGYYGSFTIVGICLLILTPCIYKNLLEAK